MRRQLRGLIVDQWLIISLASLVIVGVSWLAFTAIHYRAKALAQQRYAEQQADWINDRLPGLLRQAFPKESNHGEPISEYGDRPR